MSNLPKFDRLYEPVNWRLNPGSRRCFISFLTGFDQNVPRAPTPKPSGLLTHIADRVDRSFEKTADFVRYQLLNLIGGSD
ncbi:hypothetical protein N183_37715 [Sinorhizobium sp. Sb3]|nr:hypothetical protein N183_37715 [Sinorhizobium sp. Sb3]